MDQRATVLLILVSWVYEAIASPPLRIVNGTTADDGEFPYLVQLRGYAGIFTCGGAIIGSEWILTAGHCFETEDIESIVYGTNKLYDEFDGYPNTSIAVKKLFQHPKFTYSNSGNPIYDVAILQLVEPIPWSESAQPIKLAEANATIPFHIQGILAGWGVNETYQRYPSPYLQKIDLQLLTDQECTKKINDYSRDESFISIHNLCSDDYYNGECYGDSGSPYVINDTLYGLVSWSYKPCGIIPGTYSRITNPEYRKWIKDVTNI